MTTGQKIWLSILSVVCVLTLILCLDNNQTWRNYFVRESDEIVQDSTAMSIQQEIEEQTNAENPSIVEYLQYRDKLKEDKRKEAVFLNMPEVVIVDILRDISTDLSIYELVEIYENYPTIYNSVQSGAKSQQYLDSINSIKDKIDSIVIN